MINGLSLEGLRRAYGAYRHHFQKLVCEQYVGKLTDLLFTQVEFVTLIVMRRQEEAQAAVKRLNAQMNEADEESNGSAGCLTSFCAGIAAEKNRLDCPVTRPEPYCTLP